MEHFVRHKPLIYEEWGSSTCERLFYWINVDIHISMALGVRNLKLGGLKVDLDIWRLPFIEIKHFFLKSYWSFDTKSWFASSFQKWRKLQIIFRVKIFYLINFISINKIVKYPHVLNKYIFHSSIQQSKIAVSQFFLLFLVWSSCFWAFWW